MTNELTPEQYFADDSFIVRGGEVYNDQAILFMSFDYEDSYVNLSVYDYTARKYTHELTEITDVDDLINSIEDAYQVTVPSEFRTLPNTFLAVKDEIKGVRGYVSEGSNCETCGWNVDEVEAYYFPGIPGKIQETVHVSTRFGCYGGDSASGAFSENHADAIRILNSISSDDTAVQREVDALVEHLETVASSKA